MEYISKKFFFFTHALFLIFSLTCCSEKQEDNEEQTVCIFNPKSQSFFDVPFPSEMHRAPDGKIDLSSFPNPRKSPWITNLLKAISEDCKGFGTNSGIYFRFSQPIDTSTLPSTPSSSVLSDSSVLLVNLDKSKPNFGMKIPVQTFFREKEGFMWQPNTLVILPAQGFVLDADTLYGAIVTDRVKDINGRSVVRDIGFENLIDDRPDDGTTFSKMEELHRNAIKDIEELKIAEASRITSLALFKTMDPVWEMKVVAQKVYDEVEAPSIYDISLTDQTDDYYLFEGHYGPNPVFQRGWSSGLFPYEREGGEFVFDENGNPLLDGNETLTFALTIPRSPMPEPDGYPVLLYAHGTGGDYLSFVRDDTALKMAKLGIAVFGIDNAMNGTRIPENKSPELLFFNIMNIRAGRDNNRQAAVDVIQQERMAESLVINASISPTGEEIKIDGSKIIFMGHSQGGLNGSLYLALSRKCLGGYLSGSAGNILYSIQYKKSPIDTLAAFALVVGLTGDDIKNFDFGIFHPLLNLVQTFVDPSDPINYGMLWFKEPLEGIPPKSIMQSEGLGDSYAPPIGIEALGVAAQIPPVTPVLNQVESYSLKNILPIDPPVTGNIQTRAGKITAGFLQYIPPEGIDGHFVTFYNQEAIETWTFFLSTLADTGLGTIR